MKQPPEIAEEVTLMKQPPEIAERGYFNETTS